MPRPKRTRRKAKQPRAHQTVAVILEAAARVLQRWGYAAATTNRIAREAGVSVGSVYEYFSDKEAVFEALIRRELGRLVETVGSVPLHPRDPLDAKLGRLLAAAMEAVPFGPSLFRALDAVPGAAFRSQLEDARRAFLEVVRGLLETHRAELRVTDLDLAAFLLVGAAEGVGGNASDDRFDEALARELADLARAYLVGTESRPAGPPSSPRA